MVDPNELSRRIADANTVELMGATKNITSEEKDAIVHALNTASIDNMQAFNLLKIAGYDSAKAHPQCYDDFSWVKFVDLLLGKL